MLPDLADSLIGVMVFHHNGIELVDSCSVFVLMVIK